MVVRSVEKQFLPWVRALASAGTKIAAVGSGVVFWQLADFE